jgi:hypothetical protein
MINSGDWAYPMVGVLMRFNLCGAVVCIHVSSVVSCLQAWRIECIPAGRSVRWPDCRSGRSPALPYPAVDLLTILLIQIMSMDDSAFFMDKNAFLFAYAIPRLGKQC